MAEMIRAIVVVTVRPARLNRQNVYAIVLAMCDVLHVHIADPQGAIL